VEAAVDPVVGYAVVMIRLVRAPGLKELTLSLSWPDVVKGD